MTDQKTELIEEATHAIANRDAVGVLEMKLHFASLHALKAELMSYGTDYGKIPGGGDKPTLFKAGAEKILQRFMVAVDELVIEDLSQPDLIRYRVRCVGRTPDGVVRGIGVGTCSSDEEKYRWRKAVSKAEYKAAPEERRRLKYYNDGTAQQVRTSPADVENTILKMAKKRAGVDLALTACGASQFFTQDIEDLPEDIKQQVAAERRAAAIDTTAEPVTPAAATPAPKQTAARPAVDARAARELAAKARVWAVAQPLGYDGDGVAAVISALDVPKHAGDWRSKHFDIIIEAVRGKAPKTTEQEPTTEPEPESSPAPMAGDAEHQVDEEPPVLEPYPALLKAAETMGATETELMHAVAGCGLADKPYELFTVDDGDAVIVALEDMKGA